MHPHLSTECPSFAVFFFFFKFLAAPGLHCCTWDLYKRSLLSGYGAWASLVVELGLLLWSADSVVVHGLSSWTRDGTRVPCVGRQILNHWTTRCVLKSSLIVEE